MATVDLGAIRFNWKGAYAGGTAYVVDDVVSSGGSSYMCILASTGNVTSNATYWSVMAEGGDVATTLTTQGDVLFRDGSGLQRLAKGTAGQVLKVNGGATAPEWGTDSLDLTADQSWTGSQRATIVTDNDGSFDLNLGQNFACTVSTGTIAMTFTNIPNGQSGFIKFINSGATMTAHANTKVDATLLTTINTAGTYLISYFSDGTDVWLTNSAIYT
jgi:hypothetical protein